MERRNRATAILEANLQVLVDTSSKGSSLSVQDARRMIQAVSAVFTTIMVESGHDARQVLRITTKLRDSGRRSPPWKPASSRVPGRPQDGADGNRITRWSLPVGHKFYADEVTATLVEVKYYLQALSMDNAPRLMSDSLRDSFNWMLGHPVEPGTYFDPIQLTPIDIYNVVANPRSIQSGHLIPLNRGGLHEPSNAFLMLERSNQLQGNLTLEELLELMEAILIRHRQRRAESP